MSTFYRKNKKERGSSIIVLILFTAMASMVIVAMEGLVESSRTLSSKHGLDLEYKEILLDIKNTVGHDAFCNSTTTGLTGLRLQNGTDLRSLQIPGSLNINIPGASQPTIGPGWLNANRKLRFVSYEWEFVSIETSGDISRYVRATTGVRSRKALYRLIVNMKYCRTQACDNTDVKYFTNKRRETGASDNTVVRDGGLNVNAIDIPLYVHLRANNSYNVVSGAPVVSCFAEGSGGDYCEKLGSVWNQNASTTRYRCEPRVSCRYRKALPDGTCATASDPEVLSRFRPIIEGMGVLRADGTVARGVPNISNCSWCNPYY